MFWAIATQNFWIPVVLNGTICRPIATIIFCLKTDHFHINVCFKIVILIQRQTNQLNPLKMPFSDWKGEPRAARGSRLHPLSWWPVRGTGARKTYPEVSRVERQGGDFVFLLPWCKQSQPLQAAVQEPDEQHRADGEGEGGDSGGGCVRIRVQHPGEKTRKPLKYTTTHCKGFYVALKIWVNWSHADIKLTVSQFASFYILHC